MGEWRHAFRKSRREQVVIFRLCIGHTRLTHSFTLKQEPQTQCLTGHTTCTFKHILIECRAFIVIRKRFFKVNSLTDVFENVKKMTFCPSCERQGFTKKYDELKLVNHVQTNEILLKENFNKYSFRNLWLNVYTYRQNLALNNQQGLIRHKTKKQKTKTKTANHYIFQLKNPVPISWLSFV